jgi:hypothetical protein
VVRREGGGEEGREVVVRVDVRERVGGERAALLRLWQHSVVAGAVVVVALVEGRAATRSLRPWPGSDWEIEVCG